MRDCFSLLYSTVYCSTTVLYSRQYRRNMMVSDIISVVVVFCLLLHGAAAAFAAAIHPSIDLDADTARDVMLTLRGRALDAVVAMPSASSQGSRQGRADTLAGPKSIPNPKTLVPRTKAWFYVLGRKKKKKKKYS